MRDVWLIGQDENLRLSKETRFSEPDAILTKKKGIRISEKCPIGLDACMPSVA